MPLTINVGLSRKASKDYQSSGVSINVTAELDQSLLARPRELQAEIDRLYAQAEEGLARQAERPDDASQSNNGRPTSDRGNGRPAPAPAPATRAQRKAIDAIGRRLGLDVIEEIRHEFGWALDRLSVAEASKVIDHLKGLTNPQAAGNGGGR